ncbi:hypothetical protein BDZ94DRAFT_1241567 [Collybia nuda]|uniref:Uncharacterized protein n=1 Tax=Collybia nuda TaxID=64659 RepID=A0A9P6CBT9_9AGAR|nr:hypothetical protein BDZ94DRAFT_1241567 [Collybia nuda]
MSPKKNQTAGFVHPSLNRFLFNNDDDLNKRIQLTKRKANAILSDSSDIKILESPTPSKKKICAPYSTSGPKSPTTTTTAGIVSKVILNVYAEFWAALNAVKGTNGDVGCTTASCNIKLTKKVLAQIVDPSRIPRVIRRTAKTPASEAVVLTSGKR